MKKSKLLLYDPMIISRVRQYLEENVHQTYVDVAVMAKELQDRHRDYGRRKIAPFRQLVEQAYKTVLHSYGLDSNPSSDNEGDPSDIELMDENEQANSNHMNNTITSLYMNNKKTTPSNDGELIDISSDEDMENYSRKSISKKPSELLKLDKNTCINATKVAEKGNELHPILKKSTISGSNSMSTFGNSTNIFSNAGNVPGNSTCSNINSTTVTKPSNSHEHSTSTIQQTNTKKRKIDGISTDGVSMPTSKPRKYKKTVSSTLSNITFKNVGGMEKILKELCELLLHVKHPDVYHHLGLPPPRGFLLHGPPGSGKTLLAQAIAGQLEVPLIQVAATELVAGVSGESEERIREVFEQAACVAPCVLFIDEVDAISANRQNAQKDMERRIVAQLLSSLDGLSKQINGDMVLVIGAANSPDTLDPSLRRVGRFDQEICLGIPDRDSRAQILRVICDDLKLERPFDYDYLASLTPGFVGADLLALATRAATTAVKRAFSKKEETILKRKIMESENNVIVPVDLTDDLLMNDDNDSTNHKPEETIEDSIKDLDENKDISVDNDTNENSIIDIQNDSDKGALSDPEPLKSNSEIVDAIVDAIVENKKSELAELKEKEKELIEETVKEADNVILTNTNTNVNEINDVITKEILKQPQLKLQITLTEMMKWLNGDNPLITENELYDLCITMKDFKYALKVVQPSAKREGFITVPDVTWDDIGSLRDIREELKLAILAPVKYPNKLKALGLNSPSGVLLCGPPGCGKTLLAKAIANEAGINFISVKGPELLNMYVGESERAVRQCFQRARNSAPCVIFFDEFDALCPKRSDSTEGGAGMRVVNQLLTEMDGVEDRKGVFLMAATNRPDIVDPAVLRPGRLDKTLYVGFPNTEDRLDILKAITKKGTKPTLASDVDLDNIANLTDGYTGADLAGLIRQASLQALKISIANETIPATDSVDNLAITNENMLSAISRIKPSISLEEKLNYNKLRLKYAAPQQLNDKMDI